VTEDKRQVEEFIEQVSNPSARKAQPIGTISYKAGYAVGVTLVAMAGILFWSWLLGVILGWFAVALPFWKCVVIYLFLRSFSLTVDRSP